MSFIVVAFADTAQTISIAPYLGIQNLNSLLHNLANKQTYRTLSVWFTVWI